MSLYAQVRSTVIGWQIKIIVKMNEFVVISKY